MVKTSFLGFTSKQQRRVTISLSLGYLVTFLIGYSIISFIDPMILNISIWQELNIFFKFITFGMIGFILGSLFDLIVREL